MHKSLDTKEHNALMSAVEELEEAMAAVLSATAALGRLAGTSGDVVFKAVMTRELRFFNEKIRAMINSGRGPSVQAIKDVVEGVDC